MTSNVNLFAPVRCRGVNSVLWMLPDYTRVEIIERAVATTNIISLNGHMRILALRVKQSMPN